MHSVLIVIHLFVAIGLVSVILLQRSEGGALGMGGGPGGLMSGRQAGNVLTKATTGLALVFFITSISLTIFANLTSGGPSSGVIERLGETGDAPGAVGTPPAITGADDLSGFLGEQPAADAPAETPAEPAPLPVEPAAPETP